MQNSALGCYETQEEWQRWQGSWGHNLSMISIILRGEADRLKRNSMYSWTLSTKRFIVD